MCRPGPITSGRILTHQYRFASTWFRASVIYLADPVGAAIEFASMNSGSNPPSHNSTSSTEDQFQRQPQSKILAAIESPFLIPVVKLGEDLTHAPWEAFDCRAVVVKLQDLVSSDGRRESRQCREVRSEGGLHRYLSYTGAVILSSIMPDETICGMTPKCYASIINDLGPDYYLTPDGETYLGERHLSTYEIKRILNETSRLLESGLNSLPIGLVKGSNLVQNLEHTRALKELGIKHFAFHAGSFLDGGTAYSVAQARAFSTAIRKTVPWLLIYGVGSRSHLERFSFADAFVTHSHFTDAFRGIRLDHGRKSRGHETLSREAVIRNLAELNQWVSDLRCKAPLDNWLAQERANDTRLAGKTEEK